MGILARPTSRHAPVDVCGQLGELTFEPLDRGTVAVSFRPQKLPELVA